MRVAAFWVALGALVALGCSDDETKPAPGRGLDVAPRCEALPWPHPGAWLEPDPREVLDPPAGSNRIELRGVVEGTSLGRRTRECLDEQGMACDAETEAVTQVHFRASDRAWTLHLVPPDTPATAERSGLRAGDELRVVDRSETFDDFGYLSTLAIYDGDDRIVALDVYNDLHVPDFAVELVPSTCPENEDECGLNHPLDARVTFQGERWNLPHGAVVQSAEYTLAHRGADDFGPAGDTELACDPSAGQWFSLLAMRR